MVIENSSSRVWVVSSYMAHDHINLPPPEILKLLVTEANRIGVLVIIGADANAHHEIWGSTNTNERVTQENVMKYKCRKDIKYGNGKNELMDIYYKDEEKDTPIVVYIHGGYWKEFSKEESAYCAGPLIENGCRVIVVGYDMCPLVTVADIIEEIRKAIKEIFKYAEKTNAKSVSVIGHSAGACMVLSMINEDLMNISNIELLKGLYAAGGIYDLSGLEKTSVNENNALSINADNVKKLSPMFQDFGCLKGKKVKLYICVGEYDSPMFIEHAEDINDHLQTFGLDSKYVFLKGYDHFDIVEDLSKDDYEITQILLQNIK